MSLEVLVVDDSTVYRHVLTKSLDQNPLVSRTRSVSTGKLALSRLEADSFDVVFLDVEMPEMDGIETLKRIKEKFPKIEVIMISAVNERGAAKIVHSFKLGCLEFIRKPTANSPEEGQRLLTQMVDQVLEVLRVRFEIEQPKVKNFKKSNQNCPSFFDLVVIGTSTGGPEALNKVIPQLPGDFNLPILLVQHIPPVFSSQLAEDLNDHSQITVKEVQGKERLESGTVYIAPGDAHLIVQKNQNSLETNLSDAAPENSCRPAVDVLFRSVAQSCSGKNILAVILTGMGSDGMKGVQSLKESGTCWCITQSQDTCAIYGMPRAVDEADLSDEQIDLKDISSHITKLVAKSKVS